MEKTVASLVNAAIRGLGNHYADGTERIEIHVPSDHAHGLPHSKGIRVPVVLHVGDEIFDAGLRSTAHNDYVWICPNLTAKDGCRKRLADIVAAAGFKKNDHVCLLVTGNDIVLKHATSQ